MTSLNPQEVRQILDALEASQWDEALVTIGDVSISVSRGGSGLFTGGSTADPPPAPAPAAAPSPAAPAAAAPSPAAPATAAPSPAAPAAPSAPTAPVWQVAGGTEVTSPTVGIFWRAPEPGAPPFAEVGGSVVEGDIVAIVEVMKLMNNVTAPVSGIVSAIHVENAAPVEYGQPLLTITPA